MEEVYVIFKCPIAKATVKLKVQNEIQKGFFKKIISQNILECDLKEIGGCRMKLNPLETPTCVAWDRAKKCNLK